MISMWSEATETLWEERLGAAVRVDVIDSQVVGVCRRFGADIHVHPLSFSVDIRGGGIEWFYNTVTFSYELLMHCDGRFVYANVKHDVLVSILERGLSGECAFGLL